MKKTETETKTNQFTTVKTGYARIAVLLLAINFCLTGYVVYSMNSTMQMQIDQVNGIEESSTKQVLVGPTASTIQTVPSDVTDTPDDTESDQAKD